MRTLEPITQETTNNLLNFLIEFKLEHNGLSPSFEQMSKAIDRKKGYAITRALQILEDAGEIKKTPRGIVVFSLVVSSKNK